MESSAALPHAARELLLKGGGCAVNFECAPELCAPLRAELARSGRSVGFVRADEGFYDRMDTAAYLRLFERMAGTRGMADAALAAMLAAEGPYLLDVAISRDQNVFPMVAPGRALDDVIGAIDVAVGAVRTDVPEAEAAPGGKGGIR